MKVDSTLYEAFSIIPEQRKKKGRRHTLPAVLSMTVAAMFCGATNRDAIAQWGKKMWDENRDFMKRLGFKSYTTPVGATLMSVYDSIDINAFEHVLSVWIECRTGSPVADKAVSIDGKTLRGSARHKENVPGVHLISAYLHDPGCVLGQMRVDSKTNEFKAALDLIEKLILKDSIFVGDAMYCQKEFAQAVIDKECDYFLVVKGNQSALKEEIETAFMEPFSPLGRETAA